MTTILVPFHQDERFPDASFPTRVDHVVAPPLPDGDIWRRLVALHDPVADLVAEHVDTQHIDTVPTVLSGDCLVAAAVLAGTQRAGLDPAIVWFDAHGDVHTVESSTTGYLGGLALRLLVGGDRELLAGPLGITPVAEDRVVLVDARDLDPAEVDYLAGSRIRRATVADLGELPDGPLILHLDVDVIDSAELPGLRVPAPGGPSTADVLAAVAEVRRTGRVVALDIAGTWLPTADTTAPAALLAALTGPA